MSTVNNFISFLQRACALERKSYVTRRRRSSQTLSPLKQEYQFETEIYEVADKKYGSPINGTWNGLVADIVNNKADFAMAAMTITPARANYVDFTSRFDNFAVSLIMQKDGRHNYKLFSFMDPFSLTVWLSITISFSVVSCLLYVLNRISPKRMKGPRYHDTSLHGTFWFVFSAFVQQSTDMYLVTLSSQCVTGCWWLFTLIIISNYTAKLASAMTVKNLVQPVQTIEALSMQKDIKYGTVFDSSTYNDFEKKFKKEQEIGLPGPWTKIWNVISNPENSYMTAEEGFNRVNLDPNYAFLWDSPILKWKKANDKECKLMTIEDEIFQRGYGIATQLGSPITDKLSLGILKLQDNGNMTRLQHKHWDPKEAMNCQNDDENRISNGWTKMKLSQLLGPFVVLAGGTLVGTLIAIYEVYSYVNRGRPYPPRDPKKLPQLVGRDLNPYLSIQRRKNNDLHIVLANAFTSDMNRYKQASKITENMAHDISEKTKVVRESLEEILHTSPIGMKPLKEGTSDWPPTSLSRMHRSNSIGNFKNFCSVRTSESMLITDDEGEAEDEYFSDSSIDLRPIEIHLNGKACIGTDPFETTTDY